MPSVSDADPLAQTARTVFGVDYIFPYQRLVVSNVLEGKDQIVVLPTGAGKSFCFLLPAALLDGLTVIVYPLRSLIADQARRLSSGAISAESLTGETPKGDRPAIYERCRTGETRILLTNPEMLIQPRVKEELSGCKVAHLVIDEAHVLPEWGDTFRPAYREFADSSDSLAPRIKSAFTATASPSIISRLEQTLFGGNPPHRVTGIPDRPNIRYSVRPTLSVRHELRRLALTAPRPMLIFCRSRAGAELTAAALREDTRDRRIRFYHAGLEPEEKHEIEQWFFDADDAILASTCAYGMGVDKSNIRTVAHADVPESVEAYLQETGRAGRDADQSFAVAVAPLHTWQASRPAESVEARRRELMIRYLTSDTECRRRYLLRALGAQEVECSGCDVCDGEVSTPYDAARRSLRFFRRHAHRFDREEAAIRLAVEFCRHDPVSWTRDDAEELLEELRRCDLAGSPRHPIGRALYGFRLALRRGARRRIMRHGS